MAKQHPPNGADGNEVRNIETLPQGKRKVVSRGIGGTLNQVSRLTMNPKSKGTKPYGGSSSGTLG